MMALVDVSEACGCMGWPCGQEHLCTQLPMALVFLTPVVVGQAVQRACTGSEAYGQARAQRVPNLFIVHFGTNRVIATGRVLKL